MAGFLLSDLPQNQPIKPEGVVLHISQAPQNKIIPKWMFLQHIKIREKYLNYHSSNYLKNQL